MSDDEKLTVQNMFIPLRSMIDAIGIMGHNTNSYSEFLEHGIEDILCNMFQINKQIKNDNTKDINVNITSYILEMNFFNVHVDNPICEVSTAQRYDILYPKNARINSQQYSGKITLSVKVKITALYKQGNEEIKEFVVPNIYVGNIPIMVRSSKCNTYNLTNDSMLAIGEDPDDQGGYFIAKGEWIVDLAENIRHNTPHIYIATTASEKVRCEFMSQPGGPFDNSSLLRVKYMEAENITIELNSIKFETVPIPFFTIYRIFGMMSDLEITKTIVFDINQKDPVTLYILDALERAFHHDKNDLFLPKADMYNREKVVLRTAEKLSKMSYSKTYENELDPTRYVQNTFLSNLDNVLLPNMGRTESSRYVKLRLIGLIIRRMFLVHLGIIAPTDRDNFSNKRLHGPGISLAKAFKTQINNNFVNPAHTQLSKMLKDNPFNSINDALIINTFKAISSNSQHLNRAMEQSITSSSKEIVQQNKVVKNRVSSSQLERKNPLNTLSALRTISCAGGLANNKTTARADEMRRVHPSYVGYICLIQSHDTGEKVGLKKQIAITGTICSASDYLLLEEQLKDDIIPLSSVPLENTLLYHNVFVNGKWVGFCENAFVLARKYRLLRRSGAIDKFTSIYVNAITSELEFWLDVGRLTRPLLIVNNNLEEYDAARAAAAVATDTAVHFKQQIAITRGHLIKLSTGEIDLNTLIADRVVEYITPEEAENCYTCPSITQLYDDQHDVCKQYTHCDIQQAMLGFPALMTPYGDHTKPERNTLATNHLRSASGWYSNAYPWRVDKNRFFQYSIEQPLVSTFAYNYVMPSAMNIIIAYMNWYGENQEDSAVVNRDSVERGLFSGLFFRSETVELEDNCTFEPPHAATTDNIKKNSDYSKLGPNGVIRKGSIVTDGTILICMIQKLAHKRGNYTHTDRSHAYNLADPAVVEDAFIVQGGDRGVKMAVVKLKYYREFIIGDKASSRSGNKSIVARLVPACDMPFTEGGLTPDLIINPHSFPTRMAIGQMIETLAQILAAHRGSIYDGTTFLPVDLELFEQSLVDIGFRYNGKQTMRNGLTGEYFDAAIFIGPTSEQRSQKFAIDDEQMVGNHTPTDPITGQPIAGKAIGGGLRVGEMEMQCLTALGSMNMLYEKSHLDSDGRDIYVCRSCRTPAIYNKVRGKYRCVACKQNADIIRVESNKASVVLQQYLMSAGINIELFVEAVTF